MLIYLYIKGSNKNFKVKCLEEMLKYQNHMTESKNDMKNILKNVKTTSKQINIVLYYLHLLF